MFHCTSLRLPPEAAIKRENTRPVEFRQPGFDEAFDATTLFYDVILSPNEHGNDLIFIGPRFGTPVECGRRLRRRHMALELRQNPCAVQRSQRYFIVERYIPQRCQSIGAPRQDPALVAVKHLPLTAPLKLVTCAKAWIDSF